MAEVGEEDEESVGLGLGPGVPIEDNGDESVP